MGKTEFDTKVEPISSPVNCPSLVCCLVGHGKYICRCKYCKTPFFSLHFNFAIFFTYVENSLNFNLADFPVNFIKQFVSRFFRCFYQILLSKFLSYYCLHYILHISYRGSVDILCR